MICVHCDEPLPDDYVIVGPDRGMHRECVLRNVVGSVAHQKRECSCFNPDHDGHDDEEAMTLREAAIAAAEYWRQHQDQGISNETR